jgi:hypothetical protein
MPGSSGEDRCRVVVVSEVEKELSWFAWKKESRDQPLILSYYSQKFFPVKCTWESRTAHKTRVTGLFRSVVKVKALRASDEKVGGDVVY